jgi:hypothetical protein
MPRKFNLERIRSRAYKFSMEIEEHSHLNWAGLLDNLNMSAIYDKYADIFEPEALEIIRDWKSRGREEARRMRSLLGLLTGEYIGMATKESRDEFLSAEAKLSVEYGGVTIPLRAAISKMMNEPDRGKRIAIDALRRKARLDHLTPLREKGMLVTFDTVRGLGYKNYIEMCAKLQDRDFYAFRDVARDIIKRTDAVYKKALASNLKEFVGVPAKQAQVTDLLMIKRAPKFDKYFDKEKLLPILKKTLLGLGFDLDRQRNIVLDTEERPKKIPRPCVSAVNPPKDVRLMTAPVGGQDDYISMFHETGHAEHFSHMKPDLDFEYKFWGDRGTTEGIADLFQNIVQNPLWLKRNVGMDDPDEYIRFCTFQELTMARRQCGSFLFQMELYEKASLDGMSKRFVDILTSVSRLPYTAEAYLDLDTEFYGVGYARARLFEVQLRRFLIKKFGLDWWTKKDVGRFLVKNFFVYGRRNKGEDLLRELGYRKGMDHNYFVDHIHEILE